MFWGWMLQYVQNWESFVGQRAHEERIFKKNSAVDFDLFSQFSFNMTTEDNPTQI